jgi:hypothetical protein
MDKKYKFKNKVELHKDGPPDKAVDFEADYDEPETIDGGSPEEFIKGGRESAMDDIKKAKRRIKEAETMIMKHSKKVPVKSIQDLRDIKKKRDRGE